jgi:SAM-dependent methyltransferase
MSDRNSELFPAEFGQMTNLIHGYMTSQAIAVAAKLGIADLLKEEPRTAEELANATKAHTESLNRLLRMLTSVGIFAEDADARFRQTPLSDLLRDDNPQSARGMAIFGSELFWTSWGDLHRTVMTGQPAFPRIHGASMFEYLAKHPADAAIFDAAMTSRSSIDLSAVMGAYDFSEFKRIVDVGGGHGALLHGILSVNPKLRGILADQPAVVAGAATLRTGSIADRCEVVGVDFFVSVPEGADAYIMKRIIHDWSDEDSLKILRNCRRAIRPNGKLLLIEQVLKPANEPDPGKLMDLNMLVVLGGQERTQAEFAALVRQADFSLTRVIPTTSEMSIIESQPV